MKNRKSNFGFLYEYKIWQILKLGHFIKHKHLISKESFSITVVKYVYRSIYEIHICNAAFIDILLTKNMEKTTILHV